MPTKNLAMNKVYVKRCKDKKKQAIGVEAFNNYHAEEQRSYLQNLKGQMGELAFKEERAKYMREFMRKKREKEREQLKQNQRQEVERKISATTQAKKMTDDLFSSFLSAIPEKRKRGRPAGSKNKPKAVQPMTMTLRPKKS
jgi:hypothetical protein